MEWTGTLEHLFFFPIKCCQFFLKAGLVQYSKSSLKKQSETNKIFSMDSNCFSGLWWHKGRTWLIRQDGTDCFATQAEHAAELILS